MYLVYDNDFGWYRAESEELANKVLRDTLQPVVNLALQSNYQKLYMLACIIYGEPDYEKLRIFK